MGKKAAGRSHSRNADGPRPATWLVPLMIVASPCFPAHSQGGAPAADQPPASPHLVNVAEADGVIVDEPLVAASAFDVAIARENARRIHAIMHHPALQENAIIFFPAGTYYFDGPVDGESATIMTTGRFQTFMGVDASATRLLQKSTSVEATIRLSHDTCAVRNLYVGSADEDDAFHEDWEAAPHNAAILLDAPIPAEGPIAWQLDPQILNVHVNGHGNAITLERYSRPFRNAIEIRGPWLNVYAHTVWINDAYTAIYVEQGPVMAGPAKFIDVNFYRTYERSRSKIWTTFFKSERHFMEQVEIIHCTFIGAQFISMDGRVPEGSTVTGTPAYDMVIDHNYINVVANENTEQRSDPDARWSGVYLNLPAKRTPDGAVHYTRDIRFTNNSCSGRSPANGAFFYAEGMCRGITFAENDVSCAIQARCVYIRPDGSGVGADANVGIHDVDISGNYFRNWSNLVTIGAETRDGDAPASRVKRAAITRNRNTFESALHHAGGTAIAVRNAEQVVVDTNLLAETGGAGIEVSDTEEVIVTGNTSRGLGRDKSGTGIYFSRVSSGIATANTLSNWACGISIANCRGIVLSDNVCRDSGVGIACADSRNIIVTRNIFDGVSDGIQRSNLAHATVKNNHVTLRR